MTSTSRTARCGPACRVVWQGRSQRWLPPMPIRELIIPFGHTGYVALFEIVDNHTVIIGAIRHQREDDYH